MSYETWVELFGHTTEDPALQAKLKAAGIKDKIKIPRSETDVRKDLPGMVLIFTDLEILEGVEVVGVGTCVLTGIVLRLAAKSSPYGGSLPKGLTAKSAKPQVRKTLGKPLPNESGVDGEQFTFGTNLLLTIAYGADDVVSDLAR